LLHHPALRERLAGAHPGLQWSALAIAALALSFGLDHLGLPAALMLGPMIVAIFFALGGATIRLSRPIFLLAQGVIGCLVARAMTLSTLMEIARDWPLLVLAVAATILFSCFAGWMAGRFGRIPGDAAAWGSLPGMAGAMVAVSQDHGADSRLVAFMQYVRVAGVVLAVSIVSRLLVGPGQGVGGPAVAPISAPFTAQTMSVLATLAIAALGPFAARLHWIPTGAMIVPMVLGAALQISGQIEISLPHWLLALSYAAIGVQVGLRFTRDTVAHAVRAVPSVLMSTIVVICLSGLSAWALVAFVGIDPLTAFLATSPGSIDSVAIVALGSNADAPFILSLQTLRLFIVILAGPLLARQICRLAWRT
jgi:membrane AbrB-like protein